jgi:hypothetical protein
LDFPVRCCHTTATPYTAAAVRERARRLSRNDERDQTLNQIPTEGDGFDASTGVIVLAATNRPAVLDPAPPAAPAAPEATPALVTAT